MKISMRDYNLKSFTEKDLWEWDEIIGKIEDLESEIDRLEEKYNDLEEDLENNYTHRPMSDYTGDRYDDMF